MRIAIIGSTGQLGTDLVEVLKQTGKYVIFPLSHAQIECTDLDSVKLELIKLHPEIVVNCAAFVRVDECEVRPEEAFKVNALGAFHIARVSAELNALCVYISTDYVFDGEKEEPYTEEDPPYPINVYGTSKLAGEYLISQACPRWLIVRMASLFGNVGTRGKGGNFVETILTKAKTREPLRVVNDIRMSPTYSYDAARVLEELIREEATGIFHVTNKGSCTWYDFAREILELAGIAAKLEPVSSLEYPTKASRPKNSSLRSTKISEQRSWEQTLRAYLLEKGYTRS
jgi:dTDP-4-dehydrorhamnose reductase